MKAICTLLAAMLLSCGIAACDASQPTASTPTNSTHSRSTALDQTPAPNSQPPPGGYLKSDGDKDSDDEAHAGRRVDDDDDLTLLNSYGGQATTNDKKAVASVVRRYLTALAAGQSGQACLLLSASLASGLGQPPSSTEHQPGTTCAAEVTQLLASARRQLTAEEIATMVITKVHVKADLGMAVLGFRRYPERAILVEREGRRWTLGALFPTGLP